MPVYEINHRLKVIVCAHCCSDDLQLLPEYFTAVKFGYIAGRSAKYYNTPARVANIGQFSKSAAEGAIYNYIKTSRKVLQFLSPILRFIINPGCGTQLFGAFNFFA